MALTNRNYFDVYTEDTTPPNTSPDSLNIKRSSRKRDGRRTKNDKLRIHLSSPALQATATSPPQSTTLTAKPSCAHSKPLPSPSLGQLTTSLPPDFFAGPTTPVSSESILSSPVTTAFDERELRQIKARHSNWTLQEGTTRSRHARQASNGSSAADDGQSTRDHILSIEEIINRHAPPSDTKPRLPVPPIPVAWQANVEPILSIDEIIKRNAGVVRPPVLVRRATDSGPVFTSRSRQTTQSSTAGSSCDSALEEALSASHRRPSVSLRTASPRPALSERSASSAPSQMCGGSSGQTISHRHEEEIAQYLRSPRLTRMVLLRKLPNQHLQVSMADVGDPQGNPVVVFLGLGSVRYLVALYDEIAAALGLRLICIDRWGMGKTSNIPDSRRGFLEWSLVVEEVLEQLGIKRFSVLAHSAGTPYAFACSLRFSQSIVGSLHLLAPWISMSAAGAAGSYKWLKYVPSRVIRTAQSAEWKVQSWKLGKPPMPNYEGLGFDPKSPISSESAAKSPVFASSAAFSSDPADEDEDAINTNGNRLSVWAASSSPHSRQLSRQSSSSGSILPTRARRISRAFTSPFIAQAKEGPALADASRSSSSLYAPSVNSSRFGHASAPPSVRGDVRTSKADLGLALLRASHAESMKGGTSDLLSILDRTSKRVGFSHTDVTQPVLVWHGSKDEKISLQSALALQTTMPDCRVNVVSGADHSLMTNVPVLIEVLGSIAAEWRADACSRTAPS